MRSPRPDAKPGHRHGSLATLTGLLAAGLVLAGAATLVLRTAGEWADPATAHAADETDGKKAVAKKVTAKAKPAAKSATSEATKTKKRTVGAQTLTQVDEQVAYQYNALGRRDPFQSMVKGEFVGADVGGDAPPDIGGIKVVGIVWGARDKFAMVEDPRGNSLVLRRGDKVMNGVVERLRRDAIVIKHTTDELSELVTIPLTKKGDSNASQ